MDKRKILIQLDSDPQPSVFDRVVAVDAGVDELFSYAGVKVEQVRDLVHGAIFTRDARDLARTALFIGGSDVGFGEKLLAEAVKHMIPAAGLRVSVLLDSNGANTTAAAAVRAAGRHLPLAGARALVLGGTGPVGQRVALLLAREGAQVRVGSRQASRAAGVVQAVQAKVPGAVVEAVTAGTAADVQASLEGCALVIAAGAAGVVLVPQAVRTACPTLKVAIDLNAVPPLGIEGIAATDKARERGGVFGYGAIGVGGTKMKIHRLAIAQLFERNDQVMDAEQVYALAEGL